MYYLSSYLLFLLGNIFCLFYPRNQCQVMELLLKKGAAIDALNNGECSTLHVAVNKQHLDCVRVLLQHKANVNIQVDPLNSEQ